jgi:hypothetical protein
MRKPTWYWRIWWWFGYRGPYRVNWYYQYYKKHKKQIDEKRHNDGKSEHKSHS